MLRVVPVTTKVRIVCIFAAAFGLVTVASAAGPQAGPKNASTQPQSSNPSPSQPPVRKSPLAPYAGLWTGTALGRTFATLRLALQEDTLSGWLEHPVNIDLTDSGELKNFSDDLSKGTIQKVQLTGDGVLLTAVDETTHEAEQFSMQLTGENTANLKMLAQSMPPGMPKPKPWKLTKAGPAAPQKN